MGAADIVDLRSDTVTQPTAAMRDAMMSAPLGDDVFGDDPTVHALQDRLAELLGKEAALYVPSGTMSNQLALRAHTRHGDEVIAHVGCHMFNYESGASAALAGVQMRLLSSDDGSLPLAQVAGAIHQGSDPHLAPTTLIAFENTHNACGGVVVPEENIEAVTALARERGIALHLDGARFFNAVVATGSSAHQMAAPFDTISICLSKGLGAPIGSVLVGDRVNVGRAHRYRKMYGGGMRQAGIVAAAGLHALEHHVARLADDHDRARRLATAIDTLDGFTVDLDSVQTNLIYFGIDPAHPLAAPDAHGAPRLVARLRERGVLIAGSAYRFRAVTHLGIGEEALSRAIAEFRSVARSS